MGPLVLPVLTAKGVIPAGSESDIGSAVIALASAGWSWYAHTTSAKLAAVTALPDVQKIQTVLVPTDTAVRSAASDAAQPKVVPAATVAVPSK